MNEDDDLRAPTHLVGPTGEFPNGKLADEDLGELRLGIRAFPDKGIVAMDFGKSISWLGMRKHEAIALGEGLIREAKKL